jgi:uncharacterized protein YbbC (DUF1343 family)
VGTRTAARRWGVLAALLSAACAPSRAADERGGATVVAAAGAVRPGITVLLEDSLHLIRGKRIALLTNQTGIDEHGVSDIELLRGEGAVAAGVRLVLLLAPEHGIRGTEDRENVEGGIDERSGLPIVSLYGQRTLAPSDSIMRSVDALVFDLQDIGTRTWTYVGAMVYAMRAAARTGTPVIVLDRPNPISGEHVQGPMLDSALANAEDHTPERPARAYALYPAPLRHGMTMGEMARLFDATLGIGAPLHVVPMSGWRRAMWFDETRLPWVRPSPNMPSPASALLYPSIVPFEASNVSVGRGTATAFQRIGAPWMRADTVAALLNAQGLSGVRFVAEAFTPAAPGDRKFDGTSIPGVRIDVTDRERVHVGRVGAALVWALLRTSADSLRLTPQAFDLRFGSTAGREALLAGEDFDRVVDAQLGAVLAFRQRVRPYLLYR